MGNICKGGFKQDKSSTFYEKKLWSNHPLILDLHPHPPLRNLFEQSNSNEDSSKLKVH